MTHLILFTILTLSSITANLRVGEAWVRAHIMPRENDRSGRVVYPRLSRSQDLSPVINPFSNSWHTQAAGVNHPSRPVILPRLGLIPESGQSSSIGRADELFAARDNAGSLTQAVTLMEQLIAREPSNYEAWWRVARLRYYLGDREKDSAKKTKLFLSGVDAAKKSVALDSKRVEGHFWFAANEGEYADLKGALQSLGLVKTIRAEFEAALAINPGYENGAIHSALGQIDLNLPRLLGGNERRGIQRLEEGLKIGTNNAELKVTLAEVYQKKGRKDEARKLLESVAGENDPARSPMEMEELRTKARGLLDKLK